MISTNIYNLGFNSIIAVVRTEQVKDINRSRSMEIYNNREIKLPRSDAVNTTHSLSTSYLLGPWAQLYLYPSWLILW
jgi:hypothetical protein